MIPSGVSLCCSVLAASPVLCYVTPKLYNPADEGRIPHDYPSIGYDWLALPPIKSAFRGAASG